MIDVEMCADINCRQSYIEEKYWVDVSILAGED